MSIGITIKAVRALVKDFPLLRLPITTLNA